IKLLNRSLSKKTVQKGIVHWWLARIALEKGRLHDFEKHLKRSRSLPLLKNVDLARMMYEKLPTSKKEWFLERLIENGFFETKTESYCPYFELDKRKKKAEFLFLLISHHR